jgi:hypothetical protein
MEPSSQLAYGPQSHPVEDFPPHPSYESSSLQIDDPHSQPTPDCSFQPAFYQPSFPALPDSFYSLDELTPDITWAFDFAYTADQLVPDFMKSLETIISASSEPYSPPPQTPSSFLLCPYCRELKSCDDDLRTHLKGKIKKESFGFAILPSHTRQIKVSSDNEASYIDSLYEVLCIKPDTQRRIETFREHLVSQVQQFFQDEAHLGLVQVQFCGSYEYGAAIEGSDVDLSVNLPEADALTQEGWDTVVRLLDPTEAKQSFDEWYLRWSQAFLARLPYKLKFIPGRVKCLKVVSRRDSSLSADLMINNFLSVRNTGLIKEYYRVGSTQLAKLIILVKHWSYVKKLNGPKANKLSSYAYVILVIAYLQMAEDLPCLLEGAPQEFIREVNVGYIKGVGQWSSSKSDYELLRGFFKFYSEFSWELQCVTIRQRAPLLKSALQRPLTGQRSYIILDPFEENRNLTDVVVKGFHVIHKELQLAYDGMRVNAHPKGLEGLFSEVY